MSIDNEKSADHTKDFFDDDFEVIYQDEDYSNLLRKELEKKEDNDSDYEDGYDPYKEDYGYEDEYDPYEDGYGRYDEGHRRDGSDDSYHKYDYRYEDRPEYSHEYDYNDYEDDYDYSSRRSRQKSLIAPELLSPASKTAKTGVTLIYKLVNLLLRSATLILIAVITYVLAINFWKNHGVYGDVLHAFIEKNYILAAYAAVAACLLLFEFFNFLLVLFTSKRNDHRGRRIDTGRGMVSFILIYAGSYLAFFLNRLVPVSPAPFQGVQGALVVYGSLRTTLLPLCVAGIVSCLVRKFIIR